MVDIVGIGFVIVSLLMALLGLAATGFWIWMLIDCVTNEPSEGNNKIIWILIIIFTHGLGALIYFFVRRPERIREHGH